MNEIVARPDFSRAERRAIVRLSIPIALLHIVCCGIVLFYASRVPALVGLAVAAYLFGLRHAFDADHIAAVDDTVRYMQQRGRDALAVGFYSRSATRPSCW